MKTIRRWGRNVRRVVSRTRPRAWFGRTMRELDRQFTRHDRSRTAIVAVILTGMAAVPATGARDAVPRILRIQFAPSGDALTKALDAITRPKVLDHLAWDAAFIVLYMAALIAWAAVINRPARVRQPIRLAVYGMIVGVGVFDAVEDIFTWRATRGATASDTVAHAIHAAAIAKWSLLALLAIGVAAAGGQRLRLPASQVAPPQPDTGDTSTEPPPAWHPVPKEDRIGISCSGGGIRSATFCLGALHGLGVDLVSKAEYLTAASGGAYTAAAMTAYALHDTNEPEQRLLNAVWAVASELTDAFVATAAGAALNEAHQQATALLSEPTAVTAAANVQTQVETAIAAGLDERAAAAANELASAAIEVAAEPRRLPFGQIQDRASGKLSDSPELARLRARASYLLLNGDEGRVSVARALGAMLVNLAFLWLVVFVVARPVGYVMSSSFLHPELRAHTPLFHDIKLERDLAASDFVVTSGTPVVCTDHKQPGTQFTIELATSERRIKYATSPSAAVAPSKHTWETDAGERQLSLDRPGVIEACSGRVKVIAQPAFKVDKWPELEVKAKDLVGTKADVVAAATPDQLTKLLKVDGQPTFESESGRQGRPKISIDGWMWVTFLVFLAAAIIAMTFGRGMLSGAHDITTRLPVTAAVCLTIAGAVLVLCIALPWACQELPRRFGEATSHLPGAASGLNGFFAWLIGAVAAARTTLTGLRKDADAKTAPAKKTSRFVLRLGALVFLVIAGTAVLFSVVQIPLLNGPSGRLMGYDLYWLGAPGSDWQRAAVVLVALLVLRRMIPAHLWSLHPLYRDRLGKAFLGDERDPEVPARVRTATIVGAPLHGSPWPELVICAAVNLNSTAPDNRIPAGRFADSFTFSRQSIGSATTGFTSSLEYGTTLRRVTDLQLSSLVAVTGAAFSPAMGKEAYGAVGGLLAILNLRLGLWLPNPGWITANTGWRVKAGWPYLLRELFGRFLPTAPFVYVTDGGHWENLGLVELIRRGCTEIYVLSAAGDGKLSSSTIGEALALAREQFGVDIDVELTPLRARVDEKLPDTGRQLISQEDGDKNMPFAPSPFAIGWFTYANGVRARILFIEANLTDDMPWDVHSHAERHSVFPDDSTANQFFNHRQFESYRRLGQHQAEQAVTDDAWTRDAQRWARNRTVKDETLRKALAAPGLA